MRKIFSFGLLSLAALVFVSIAPHAMAATYPDCADFPTANNNVVPVSTAWSAPCTVHEFKPWPLPRGLADGSRFVLVSTAGNENGPNRYNQAGFQRVGNLPGNGVWFHDYGDKGLGVVFSAPEGHCQGDTNWPKPVNGTAYTQACPTKTVLSAYDRQCKLAPAADPANPEAGTATIVCRDWKVR